MGILAAIRVGWEGRRESRAIREKGADPVLGGLLCLSEQCQISGSGCASQWPPFLFPLPGFTGNLPTPKRRLLVKAFFWG